MTRTTITSLQLLVAIALFVFWHFGTTVPIWQDGSTLIDPFFFSTPVSVIERTLDDFVSGSVWKHLYVTFLETVLAFVIGSFGGVVIGFWFARQDVVSDVFSPYLKAVNSMPRVVLAPIFALWFGLGIWSKVALGFTLVFFVVFFNVYQGVKEVSPTVLANARILGLNSRQLLRHVYLPSALSWVFSSLHTSIGFALVGAVVGEYLGASAGLGYRISQAEGVFDMTGVFSGMLILMIFVVLIDLVISFIEEQLIAWKPPLHTKTASAQA